MKLVILDSTGRELQLARVSLISGGIEITLDGSYDSNSETLPNEKVERPESINGAVTSNCNDAVTTGVLDNGSKQTTTVEAELPKPASDDGGNTVAVQESSDVPSVDKTGRCWHADIDSSSKKLVKSTGIWARRRNVDDAVYEAKVAELLSGAAELPTPGAELPTPAGELPTPGAASLFADELPEPVGDATPLPANNTLGEDDDADLDGILSSWG